MEARILKWQQIAKERHVALNEFEVLRQETISAELKKQQGARLADLLAKVPVRYRGKSFADFVTMNEAQRKVKLIAERYVTTFGERLKEGVSIKFLGKPGTGKTLLSLIMYQALAKAGYRIKYEPSLAFIKGLLEEKFKSQATFDKMVEANQHVEFLIIDEVTESISKGGAPTDIEKQVLFRLINDRYENKLCTLLITNRDESAIADRLGAAIADRLMEVSISLAFNWNSFRVNKG